MFEPPEALPIHTLSKLHYLIHELWLTNHLSFQELINCGTHCHRLLSLNPTICHLLNLTSTILILSPFYLAFPIFSVFPLSWVCYRPYGLSLISCTEKTIHTKFFYKKPILWLQSRCFLIFCRFQPYMFINCFLNFNNFRRQ